jgi:hypothetical protein
MSVCGHGRLMDGFRRGCSATQSRVGRAMLWGLCRLPSTFGVLVFGTWSAGCMDADRWPLGARADADLACDLWTMAAGIAARASWRTRTRSLADDVEDQIPARARCRGERLIGDRGGGGVVGDEVVAWRPRMGWPGESSGCRTS